MIPAWGWWIWLGGKTIVSHIIYFNLQIQWLQGCLPGRHPYIDTTTQPLYVILFYKYNQHVIRFKNTGQNPMVVILSETCGTSYTNHAKFSSFLRRENHLKKYAEWNLCLDYRVDMFYNFNQWISISSSAWAFVYHRTFSCIHALISRKRFQLRLTSQGPY